MANKLTDEAKAQNEEAAKKQKHEDKIADWSSLRPINERR